MSHFCLIEAVEVEGFRGGGVVAPAFGDVRVASPGTVAAHAGRGRLAVAPARACPEQGPWSGLAGPGGPGPPGSFSHPVPGTGRRPGPTGRAGGPGLPGQPA